MAFNYNIYVLVIVTFVSCVFCGWELSFADEFNGQTRLNTTAWVPAYSFAPGIVNSELQFYSPGAFTSEPDYLRIIGENISVNGFDYQSGVITTNSRFTQVFGYFEIRARWTSGRGLWPAFWLYGQDNSICKLLYIDILRFYEPFGALVIFPRYSLTR